MGVGIRVMLAMLVLDAATSIDPPDPSAAVRPVLPLPDRDPSLDPVDQGPAREERFGSMRRARGAHHGGFADGE